MGYVETMQLPLRAFWLMSGNVDRIQAQKDVRSLTVAACAQGGEAATTCRTQLIVEVGTIVKVGMDVRRDADAISTLKELSLLN